MRIAYVFLVALLAASCAQNPQETANGKISIRTARVEIGEPAAAKEPSLAIASPKDGDFINGSIIMVTLNVSDFRLVPINSPAKRGEGHVQVWLDSARQSGPEAEFAFENVSSGRHSIVAELVESNHSSLSPRVIKAISINSASNFSYALQKALSEFDVEADDNGFYPSTLQAKAGDMVKINFRFRDNAIYYGGLDVKGPFPTLAYRLRGQQPLTATFVMDGTARIDSYWPSSGIHKATLDVEVAK